MFENSTKTPTKGYILEKWNTTGYRATTIAYLKRENLTLVEHINGKYYSLSQLEDALIKW